jgi:hypothetical protein
VGVGLTDDNADERHCYYCGGITRDGFGFPKAVWRTATVWSCYSCNKMKD